MTGIAHGAGGVAAAAFTLPALAFAVGPIFSREPWHWQTVGVPDDFADNGTYVTKVIQVVEGIGEAGDTIAYMRKRSSIDTEPADQYNQFIALSSRCMHLGCPVRYVDAAQRFICPCHGGVYDFQGKVVGGPPPRPLDRFVTRVQNGQVQLGPRFSVNSDLKRFSPRDPAEKLDGLWQYLYPKRFTVPSPQ